MRRACKGREVLEGGSAEDQRGNGGAVSHVAQVCCVEMKRGS